MTNNCEEFDVIKTAEFLKSHDNYLILTHANPDGDTLGSGFALNMILDSIGKKSSVICGDEIPEKYSYFTKFGENSVEKGKHDTVIAVDVADNKLLGTLEAEYGDKVDICIDHHVSNTHFAKKLFLESDAAANCECIFDLAVYLKIDISDTVAKALYTGISTDTGCFRYSNTTPKTLRTAAALYEKNIDASEINRIMFETKSRARVELERQALDGIKFYLDGKCSVITVTRKMLDETGCVDSDIEGITAMSRCIEGVLAGVTVKEKTDGSYKVSLRTYPPIDASQICKGLGGGGHIRASGCQFPAGTDINIIHKTMAEAINKALGE